MGNSGHGYVGNFLPNTHRQSLYDFELCSNDFCRNLYALKPGNIFLNPN